MDILKGYIPVLLAKQFFPELLQLSALLAFLGHLFPVWLKFKGGKGVATFLGILFAISYGLAALFILTWLTMSLIFKYSSLSSIFSSLTVFIAILIKEKVTVPINLSIDETGHGLRCVHIYDNADCWRRADLGNDASVFG